MQRHQAGPTGTQDWVQSATDFLETIGIRCHRVDIVPKGFLSHVAIVGGELYFDQAALVSDILHEAGHIATCPSEVRPYMSGDLREAHQLLDELIQRAGDDDGLIQKAINSSDPEATAWAYAAGKRLGVPDELIIRDDEYDGTGADIRFGLALNSYIGINGLHHAGFCTVRSGAYARICGLPVYPAMAKWLQD